MRGAVFKNCQAILVDDLKATKEDLVSSENYPQAFKNWPPILVDDLIAAKEDMAP